MSEKVINVGKGIAGKRSTAFPKGVVIHNDAGSMKASQYPNWLKGRDLTQGFAHYYGDRREIIRVEDTYNKAWHTGNVDGNNNYVGYEICESMSASDKDFLANENAVLKQVADDFKFWGLKPNRNTVKLHNQFSATACPHRSQDLHGKGVKTQDYFINKINEYMGGKTQTVKPKPTNTGYYDKKDNVKKVQLKKQCTLYGINDVNFTQGNKGGQWKKGTYFNIKGIKYSAKGTPRLITESGFLLTANKENVKKV